MVIMYGNFTSTTTPTARKFAKFILPFFTAKIKYIIKFGLFISLNSLLFHIHSCFSKAVIISLSIKRGTASSSILRQVAYRIHKSERFPHQMVNFTNIINTCLQSTFPLRMVRNWPYTFRINFSKQNACSNLGTIRI